MNVYAAAVYTNRYMPGQRLFERLNEHERSITASLPHILESYHYVSKQQFVDEMRANGAKVFLDSGAFSAHTLGAKLDLAGYCAYIKRNEDIIKVEDGVLMASVLDGIGDPLLTYRNQLAMEWHGVVPLPCFHANEDERYLEYYISKYPYITLGGMVGASTQQLIKWLDRIWSRYLTDGSGRPRLKVHGFGITAIPIMERYPWHSCDSSSWIQATSFGSIVTPKHGPLMISENNPSRHDKNQHISTLSIPEQQYIHKMLEDHGFSYERLSKEYPSRAAYNLWAYSEINRIINAKHSGVLKDAVQELF